MTADSVLYIIYGVMVLTAIAFPFINIMFRRPRTNKGQNSGKPSFSIIIPAHDNARELENHLPCFLSQKYEGDFEIIVVESKTGDRTDEVLAKFANDKRLYSTFIPSTSRYMSRKKLAMTVGAKAARHEWLIFADAECYPKDELWLDTMAREVNDNSEMVICYGNYDSKTSDFQRYVHLVNSLYALRRAVRGHAHMAAAECVAIKREVFMNAKGFEGNLMYVRGEYDYLVNKFANGSNTAVLTAPEGWMMKDGPTKKSWKNTNLFRIDTMRHLHNRRTYSMAPTIDITAMLAAYILFFAGIIVGIITNNILLTIVSALSLILYIAGRMIIARRTFIMYGTDIPLWKVIPFEKLLLIHRIRYIIKYRLSDKLDFISHKL